MQGIPQTVLIGPDGKIQAVHVGVTPDTRKKLTEELDALTKGKSLLLKHKR